MASGSPPARPRARADAVAVQAFERQPRRGAGEAAKRSGELVARVRLDVAVGGDRQQRHVGQRARNELEREQRRGVGPVQVVEHDDLRSALGDRSEQARERVEEPEARLVGVQRGRRRGHGQRLGQLRQQAHEPGRAVSEQRAQARDVLVASDRADDLHPRPVGGRAAAVPARSPGPAGAAGGGAFDERPRERRLADPRLARQHDEAPAAREGRLQRSVELRQLVLSTHQARSAPVAHPVSTPSCSPTIHAIAV
jgi:hypothetical protein